MISTRDLSGMPDIAELKALCQSLALLDAILQPEWDLRYYSFNSRWAPGEQMASMRDGCGDEYHMLFNEAGAILKGFAHEAEMTPYRMNPPQVWQGVLDSVPASFASFLSQPAFDLEATTFCIWCQAVETNWKCGKIDFPVGEHVQNDPDGSADLLVMFNGNPRTYQEWAEEYFEQDVPWSVVQHIYMHRPLTEAIVKSLNSDLSLEDLREDLEEIGY